MDKLVFGSAESARKIVDDHDRSIKESQRAKILENIELFTRGPKQNVHVVQQMNDFFCWDEIVFLADKLVSAGYAIVCANGYFCIEIPRANGRQPGVYCGDSTSLQEFKACKVEVTDISVKPPEVKSEKL